MPKTKNKFIMKNGKMVKGPQVCAGGLADDCKGSSLVLGDGKEVY